MNAADYVSYKYVEEQFAAKDKEIERLKEQNDKFMWQVRDTCARAKKAEALIIEVAKALGVDVISLKTGQHEIEWYITNLLRDVKENATLRALLQASEDVECKYYQQKPCEHISGLQAENAALRERFVIEVKTCETCYFNDRDKDNSPCCACKGSSHWQAICKAMEEK